MRTQNEIWEALGQIDDEEALHVLTKLFAMYEHLATQEGETKEISRFFLQLDKAIELTRECNLNRR
jgi:hypothetical protein